MTPTMEEDSSKGLNAHVDHSGENARGARGVNGAQDQVSGGPAWTAMFAISASRISPIMITWGPAASGTAPWDRCIPGPDCTGTAR